MTDRRARRASRSASKVRGAREALEEMAVHLARVAGAEIHASLTRTLSIAYKTAGAPGAVPRDPVSDADRAVESIVRARLAESFPEDGIIGEEVEEPPDPARDRVWVIDPIDGTQNFINGFPLFAAAVGVLEAGRPVAGAIWCATSHELRPGVYHAREGGPLCFEERQLRPGRRHPRVLRGLEGVPDGGPRRPAVGDARITGSSALECAFVAAGLLVGARFRSVRIWDVAAGLALVRAAGGEVLVGGGGGGWRAFERFTPPRRRPGDGRPGLRDWQRGLCLRAASAPQGALPR